MNTLRDNQRDGIDELYENYNADPNLKRQLFVAPTGYGKSVVFTSIVDQCSSCGMSVVLIVKRRDLIDQASKHFSGCGIDHGVYMADHYRYAPKKKVQICSIDTLNAREIYPYSENSEALIILDECHDYGGNSKTAINLLEAYAENKIIGFTATPYRDNSMFEALIMPREAWQVRDEGFLVPERTFVPSVIDVSNVGRDGYGEFKNKELQMACSRPKIVGDIIRDWRKYGYKKRTVLFAVNIEHSKMLCKELNSAGIKAMHCDADTSSDDRKDAIESLQRHDIDVLCNVNIFSTGVDIPEIECISFCRPTQSLIYWIQAVGRGLRPSLHTGKSELIILDHAGNTYRHGSVYLMRSVNLDEKGSGEIRQTSKDAGFRTCEECFYIYDMHIQSCPICDHSNEKKQRRIEVVNGKMIEYTMSKAEMEDIRGKTLIKDYYKIDYIRKIRCLPEMFTYRKLLKKYGRETCCNYGKSINFPFSLLQ